MQRIEFFTGFSAIGLLAQFLSLVLLVEMGALDPARASLIGYVVGVMVSFITTHRTSFNKASPYRRALPNYLLVMMVGFFFNISLMFAWTVVLKSNYVLVQVVTMALVMIFTFTGNRGGTFYHSAGKK